ncbi:MAG: amylo-alpha-1,6-glucosidase [Trueperaceae bacterium]|nr:amylo-alpha-1,6-glucosidase [Trueperaceae bacterium]
MTTHQTRSDIADEGHAEALNVLRSCATEAGFLASPATHANYRRVWGRDGSIMGLAALASGDEELIDAARRTLVTLAEHQGPRGEIPSNVDPATGRVSYGGTAGRVDAGLWFAVACAEYWRYTQNETFLHEMLEPLERLRWILGAWEFNARGLLYVPPTGDWADEYVQSGYVLYDQLLYLQAQRGIAHLHEALHGGVDHALGERIARLCHLIEANYWFDPDEGDEIPNDAYHPVLYRKGREAAGHCRGRYWMPFFSPLGYGTRFDGMANGLASLFGVADASRDDAVDAYIAEELVHEDVMLVPAFDPVITPRDEYWDDLQMSFSHTFKNQPYAYHNGGLWPLVTAFHAAAAGAPGTPPGGATLPGRHPRRQPAAAGRPAVVVLGVPARPHLRAGGHASHGLERGGGAHRRRLPGRRALVRVGRAFLPKRRAAPALGPIAPTHGAS